MLASFPGLLRLQFAFAYNVVHRLARPARLFILPSEKSSGNETSSQLALRPHPSQLVNFEFMGDQLQVFPKTEILLVIYALTKQLSELCTPGKYGGGRAFRKLSNQCEVLLHCSEYVAVSNSESFMDTHSTVTVNFYRSVVVQFSW